MPEYLAPGVYVEEVDTGSKPIEGVSTSTSGMVGITERGPENVATLITGFAEFQRQFGGYLNYRAYREASYLPHAVEGFFQNGGKRVYIVRILPNAATSAVTYLADRANPATVKTTLKEKATAGTNELTVESTAGVEKAMLLKLDQGQFTEYVRVAPEDPAGDKIKLEQPLFRDHVKGAALEERTALLRVQAIDRGTWGTTLRVTSDDDESLLETAVSGDAPKDQPQIILNTTQGAERGSVLDFYIQKMISARAVILDAALDKAVVRGTRVRLKGTDWETIVAEDAAKDAKTVVLEDVDRIKQGDTLEIFVKENNTESLLEKKVESIEVDLDSELGEDLKPGDPAYVRGSRIDTTLTGDPTKTAKKVNLAHGGGVEPGAAAAPSGCCKRRSPVSLVRL